LVDRKTLAKLPVAAPRCARCELIFPVIMSRTTMPRACPFTTITSSISVRGYMATVPAAICRVSAEYAPSRSCWPVCPRA
jgi:hypothetical protein